LFFSIIVPSHQLLHKANNLNNFDNLKWVRHTL